MIETVSSLIAGEIDRRGWVQADLARVLGWPVQAMSEVMNGKRRIDAGMALDLAAISDVDAERWLSIQAAQDLAAARLAPAAEGRVGRITKRAALEDVVPVRELIKRGVVSDADPETQEKELRGLLEVVNLGDDPPYVASAKRSQPDLHPTRAQKSWIALARHRARAIRVPDYDEVAFGAMVQALPRKVRDPADFESLPEQFAGVGVRLVHVPAFPGGRIDGVSLELEQAPMIALSGRGKRIDRVLFTLLHECAHVLSGHWRAGVVRVHEGGVAGDSATEDQVNSLAESWILPNGLRHAGHFTAASIDVVAERNGVSRAVVIGHLQHQGILPWASLVSRGLPTVEEALDSWS